jgi:hypothetical protein
MVTRHDVSRRHVLAMSAAAGTLAIGALTVMILGLSTSAVSAQSAMVASGVKSRMSWHWATDSQCRPQRLIVRVVASPAHGKITIQSERMAIPAQTQGPSQCIGTSTQGKAVYYQSKPGFVGEDGFSYVRINADNASDRGNREMSRTVTVR